MRLTGQGNEKGANDNQGKTHGKMPEEEGNFHAHGILNSKVKDLLAQVGGSGTVSYEVKLNRPSLVGILLKATNGGHTAYQAVI